MTYYMHLIVLMSNALILLYSCLNYVATVI